MKQTVQMYNSSQAELNDIASKITQHDLPMQSKNVNKVDQFFLFTSAEGQRLDGARMWCRPYVSWLLLFVRMYILLCGFGLSYIYRLYLLAFLRCLKRFCSSTRSRGTVRMTRTANRNPTIGHVSVSQMCARR